MRRTFPQAFGTGNHLVDSFHVLFPRRKAQKFVITPKMLQLCALYDSASVVQWIEWQIPVLLIWVRFPSGVQGNDSNAWLIISWAFVFFSTGTTQVKHGIFVFSKNLSSDSPVIFRRITWRANSACSTLFVRFCLSSNGKLIFTVDKNKRISKLR